MKKSFLFLVLGILTVATPAVAGERQISREQLRAAIEGYWIGQLAGNYVGFPFENLYQEEPIPVLIDRYYTYKDADLGLMMNLDDRRAFVPILADALGGAWSDDDSDFEFVYLHAVEKHGRVELTYEELADAWKKHINRFIWGANREARNLMEEGLLPPATGSKEHNPFWYRISTQLTNEIWGVFLPGESKRAGEISQKVARVACDDWSTHPDLFFGVMFSAAYFEHDVEKLVEMGRAALPEGSEFGQGIDDVKAWRDEYADWREARQQMHAKYYEQVGDYKIPDPFASAMINGLAGVMALLYGEGDWMKTVAIATSLGYDCDNQAATCGALLGMIHGVEAIPERLTHEMPSRGRWTKPFNDTYINYSRDDLPAHTRISEIVERILAIAERSIIDNGGRRVDGEEEVTFTVRTDF